MGASESRDIVVLQGLDISQSMVDVAVGREVEGDVCLADMGQGLPVRGGAFDGAISISAVQVCVPCCLLSSTQLGAPRFKSSTSLAGYAAILQMTMHVSCGCLISLM